MLDSVYTNSVEKSKLLIKEMCKSIAISLINNVVSIDTIFLSDSKKKNLNNIDMLNDVTFINLNETINKEILIDQLNKELDTIQYLRLENTENISVNDDTYSSTNFSDNKSTQNIIKANSPSSDKNRRIISKNSSKTNLKRSNSNKPILSSHSNKDTSENHLDNDPIKIKEFQKEENIMNLQVDQNHEDLVDVCVKNEDVTNQKKKKNKHKKFKNRKGSSNLPKIPLNNLNLTFKKKISENVKIITNSDKKKSENIEKEAIHFQYSSEPSQIKEIFSQSIIDHQNIQKDTSQLNKEVNDVICPNVQFLSINNKITSNNNNNTRQKYNKYNNIHSPNINSNLFNHNMGFSDEMLFVKKIKNIYPIAGQTDYISPSPNLFPFLSNSHFPNNVVEFDQKHFMTIINPFMNKPIDNLNILNKFEQKFLIKTLEIKLHNDIIDYSNNIIKINSILEEIKLYSLNYIEGLIKQCLGYNNIIFDMHGSFATDLSIECSDIDLTVRIVELYNNIETLINTLFTNFDKLNIFDCLIPIYTASVPILKLQVDPMKILNDSLKEKFIAFKSSPIYNEFKFDQDELNKIKIDITFTYKNSKTHCTYSAVEWAKKQVLIYPEIKPLVHVIKRHLQINKLNSSFNGGLSSYSLLLMLVAYIKYCKKVKLRAYIDLGSILLEFYEFFGRYFDFSCSVIDINQINPIIMVNERFETYPIIHDPLNYLNVAKNSYRINEVKEIFSNAFDLLRNSKFELNDSSQDNDNLVYEMFFFFKKSIILSSN